QHLLLALAHAVRLAAHECLVAPAKELVDLVISRLSASRHLGMRVAVLTFLRTVLVLHPRVTSYNRLIKRVGQDWLGRVAARADVRALRTRNAVDRPWPASRRSSQMMIDIEQHSVTLLPEFAGRTRQDAEAPLTTLTSASRSQLASVCVPTAWDRSAT